MPRLRTLTVRGGVAIAAPVAAVLVLAMAGGAAPAAAASAGTTPLAGTQPSWASSANYAGPASPGSSVSTQVYLAGDASGLAAYAQAVTDPQSPSYQKFLTPAQVTQRFGATSDQVAAVESWLRTSGLSVRQVSPHEILAAGTLAQTESAYGTKLNEYKTKSGTFRGPASNANVPTGVAGDLLSVNGLANMPMVVKPAGLANQGGPARPEISSAKLPVSKGADGAPYLGPLPCSAYYGQLIDTTDPEINGAHQPYAICGYIPSQLRGAYGLTSRDTGAGVTVAITDAYASPTLESDADTYAVNHGGKPFAPGQFTATDTPADWTNEAACGGPAGWQSEQSLDIEAVHALAPSAKVHYYGANSCFDTDFIATLTSIIDTHSADIITNSWGEPISSTTGNLPPATISEYNALFEQAVAEGIEVSFSTGDCGAEVPSTGCGQTDTTSQPQADFPDSDPYVTAVGGTSVEIGKHNDVERTVPWGDDAWALESGSWQSVGWIYGGGGGTSGPSTDGAFPGFPQPWYQKGIVPTKLAESLLTGQQAAKPMRVVPDVSMDGDPFTGFLIGYTQELPDGTTGYAEVDYGGTSLASPLFAALVADGEQSHQLPRGFVNPILYRDDSFLGAVWFRPVITPSAAAAPYDILPAYQGSPAIAVRLGDDQLLTGAPRYSDAGGVGMPRGIFPGL
jgi:subtilase family serine protease